MINPILRREAKTSLRSIKIYMAIINYVLILLACAGLFVWGVMFNNYNFGFDPQSMVALYAVLCAVQLALILITTPALCASSISGERERQTLDLLLITKMSPASIVLGKLLSSMAVVVLMIIASLPVLGIIFYFGSVSFFSLLQMTGFLLSVGCMAGAISVFFSSILKRSAVCIVSSYAVIGLLCGATLIGFAIYNIFYYNNFQEMPPPSTMVVFLSCNPGVGFFSMLDDQLGLGIMEEIFYYYIYSSTNGPVPFYLQHFWLINIGANIFLTILFTFLSSKLINPIRYHKRK